MPIILSQNIDRESKYEDIPYEVYHFPKQYKKVVSEGEIFIYYQGNRHKESHRYYFGMGVISSIDLAPDGKGYYARIVRGIPFAEKVRLHSDSGGYYESLGRGSVLPSWRSSVRSLTEEAFEAIVKASNTNIGDLLTVADVERTFNQASNPVDTLQTLNEKYADYSPEKREKAVSAHLDRGSAVTKSLKKILDSKCQICNKQGFEKQDGDRYIEAHHLTQLSMSRPSSLCSENVILVCPDCHREIHYGKYVEVRDLDSEIFIKLSDKQAMIKKNSINYLLALSK